MSKGFTNTVGVTTDIFYGADYVPTRTTDNPENPRLPYVQEEFTDYEGNRWDVRETSFYDGTSTLAYSDPDGVLRYVVRDGPSLRDDVLTTGYDRDDNVTYEGVIDSAGFFSQDRIYEDGTNTYQLRQGYDIPNGGASAEVRVFDDNGQLETRAAYNAAGNDTIVR